MVDPFASRYPRSWGSGVRVTTRNGDVLAAARKDCKGDPEFALNESEMRVKAINLMRFAGLSKTDSEAKCDEVLSLPTGTGKPALFSAFINTIGLNAKIK